MSTVVLALLADGVSDRRLGEPETHQHLFELLAGDGWVAPARGAALRALAGFRNVLVHGYTDVDLAIVRDIVEHHLVDLDAFVARIRDRLRSVDAAGA